MATPPAEVAEGTGLDRPPPDLRSQGTRPSDSRAQSLYEELAQLTGGLAHELRNPLSTIRLNLDLLAEEFRNAETPRDERVLRKLERVRTESRRLEGLLEDFLRFVRVERLDLRPTDLNAIVEELVDFTEPQALAQSVVTRTQLQPDLPPVMLDTDLFKQALLNLLRNAHQAMPGGGESMIRTRLDGDTVVLDVIDTGAGIDPEIQPRVFEAFFSTRPRGTGLGLATTRRIVEAVGGTISLQSEPGKGSQFTIRLPIPASGQGAR